MDSFRFGLLVGLVAGLVMASLWDNDQEWDASIPTETEDAADISVEITVTESEGDERSAGNDLITG